MNVADDEPLVAERSTHVHSEIARLARIVHGTNSSENITPAAVLDKVATAAVELLPVVDHAGVTLVHKRHRLSRPELRSTAETGSVPRTFDGLQHKYGEGPCFEAIWTHNTVYIDDVRNETRWPALMAAVCAQTTIRSTLSIQLYVVDLELGALNLFSETPNAFDTTTENLADTLATHAAIALNTARRSEQFRSALASRDIIGQAKGIIMERFDIDAVHAFDILRRLSQESNTPVAEIAAQLVKTDHPSR